MAWAPRRCAVFLICFAAHTSRDFLWRCQRRRASERRRTRRRNAVARGGVKPGHFRGRTFSKPDSKRDGGGCSRWRFTQRFDGLSSSKGRADASGAGFRIDRVELGILHMTLDWSSHKRRIAGEGGVQGRGLNSSAHSRICTASTCSVLLRPSFVRAKSRI